MDDIFGLTLEGACRALLLVHTGWDEPPALYFAYRNGIGVRMSRTQLIETIALHARAEGIPPYTPGELLTGIAARCEEWQVGAAAEGTGMIGLALYSETVRVAHNPGDVAAADQISAHQRDRKLWTHPAAAEFRVVYGVESGEPLFLVDLSRGGGQINRIENVRGTIASGLKAIARAVVPNYQEK